jgi:carbonic anhydrase
MKNLVCEDRTVSNRHLLGSFFLLLALGDSCISAQEESALTPAQALQRLKDGNRRFVTDQLKKAAGKERFVELVKGQKPFATIITCADSRVSPELIFNQGLGDLFVLRVAGNVAVDSAGIVGSAEYGVAHLKTPLVLMIGQGRSNRTPGAR